ncbi:DUF2804 domain-containing protein [Fredinandcohnia quinoae]|uniref:DUF2804 domain-containing protein n=1 Tax=Fredinandcohnia quinoae TaxID=2918902 RepID=A0AAW5E5Z0_9BACI|nr:DUF2804 domain-containing protein [Fredinandcohnia sp. SECRCQ15]MCH1625467.1 DUF2804 domain-containing protein [Fredinandcohnia sp. SECRCQ15]
MQRKIEGKQRLLNSNGELNDKGYATELILDYHRDDIKARSYRIKEWDYYLIANDDFAVALTVADNSYMGLISVSLLDFQKPWYKTTSIIKPFTFGKLKLPSTSKEGDIEYHDKRIQISITHEDGNRRLKCNMKKFTDIQDFQCDIVLKNEPKDSMVIATPFAEDKKAFYYNQKINCMTAEGIALYDGREYRFDPATSFGTLDWGRGVWTYKNTWYWGSASGLVDSIKFGFNIGYGFGDTSAASENMLFYDGIAHKLEEITFHIPMIGEKYDYISPWTFTSGDGRFEMNFTPILDRSDYTSIGLIASDQHQVFGKFNGKAILDDGKVLEVQDLLGFAERVYNKW